VPEQIQKHLISLDNMTEKLTSKPLNPYMKLHQNGTDFMITLAALAAGLNSEPQNIE